MNQSWFLDTTIVYSSYLIWALFNLYRFLLVNGVSVGCILVLSREDGEMQLVACEKLYCIEVRVFLVVAFLQTNYFFVLSCSYIIVGYCEFNDCKFSFSYASMFIMLH